MLTTIDFSQFRDFAPEVQAKLVDVAIADLALVRQVELAEYKLHLRRKSKLELQLLVQQADAERLIIANHADSRANKLNDSLIEINLAKAEAIRAGHGYVREPEALIRAYRASAADDLERASEDEAKTLIESAPANVPIFRGAGLESEIIELPLSLLDGIALPEENLETELDESEQQLSQIYKASDLYGSSALTYAKKYNYNLETIADFVNSKGKKRQQYIKLNTRGSRESIAWMLNEINLLEAALPDFTNYLAGQEPSQEYAQTLIDYVIKASKLEGFLKENSDNKALLSIFVQAYQAKIRHKLLKMLPADLQEHFCEPVLAADVELAPKNISRLMYPFAYIHEDCKFDPKILGLANPSALKQSYLKELDFIGRNSKIQLNGQSIYRHLEYRKSVYNAARVAEINLIKLV